MLKEWPKEGPKLLWQVKDIGSGYGAPAVVGDRIYVISNEGMDREFLQALETGTGKKIWSTNLGKVGNPGQKPSFPAARSTPTVDGDRLYTLGSDGDLACLSVADGMVEWWKHLQIDFGGKPGIWAYAESPLVDGNTLVCTPGGADADIVALDKKSGNVIWKCAVPGNEDAPYSSAIVFETAGIRQYVQCLPKGLVGVEAGTGKLLWQHEKTTVGSRAVIPTPVAGPGGVYAAASRAGGGLVLLKSVNGGFQAESAYYASSMPAAIGGAIRVDDRLYGTTQRGLSCLDFATGSVKWEDKALGAASICSADGRLYLHAEEGEVALVEAAADGYREKGRFTPPGGPARSGPMEKAWAYPVVANGRLYIREHGVLWCYDIRAP